MPGVVRVGRDRQNSLRQPRDELRGTTGALANLKWPSWQRINRPINIQGGFDRMRPSSAKISDQASWVAKVL